MEVFFLFAITIGSVVNHPQAISQRDSEIIGKKKLRINNKITRLLPKRRGRFPRVFLHFLNFERLPDK